MWHLYRIGVDEVFGEAPMAGAERDAAVRVDGLGLYLTLGIVPDDVAWVRYS